jgi:hypothetical protein
MFYVEVLSLVLGATLIGVALELFFSHVENK